MLHTNTGAKPWRGFTGCADRLSERDVGALRAMLRCTIKALRPEVLALASGKDGVAAFTHPVFTLKFVRQPQCLECANRAHELAQALRDENTVELPASVAHADCHVDAAAAELVAGFGFDGACDVLVVGAWSCPIDELRLHGCLSACDVELLGYAAKYLRKAGVTAGLHVAPVEGE